MLQVVRSDAPVMDEDDVVPNGDREKARVERTLRDLNNPKRCRWTYIQAARRAREFKHGKEVGPALSNAEYRLLSALVEFADTDLTNCFPSVFTIAQVEGLSIPRVRALLAALVEKKWIRSHECFRVHGQEASGRQFLVPCGALAAWADGWEGPVNFANRRAPIE